MQGLADPGQQAASHSEPDFKNKILRKRLLPGRLFQKRGNLRDVTRSSWNIGLIPRDAQSGLFLLSAAARNLVLQPIRCILYSNCRRYSIHEPPINLVYHVFCFCLLSSGADRTTIDGPCNPKNPNVCSCSPWGSNRGEFLCRAPSLSNEGSTPLEEEKLVNF